MSTFCHGETLQLMNESPYSLVVHSPFYDEPLVMVASINFGPEGITPAITFVRQSEPLLHGLNLGSFSEPGSVLTFQAPSLGFQQFYQSEESFSGTEPTPPSPFLQNCGLNCTNDVTPLTSSSPLGAELIDQSLQVSSAPPPIDTAPVHDKPSGLESNGQERNPTPVIEEINEKNNYAANEPIQKTTLTPVQKAAVNAVAENPTPNTSDKKKNRKHKKKICMYCVVTGRSEAKFRSHYMTTKDGRITTCKYLFEWEITEGCRGIGKRQLTVNNK